jgi:hypothetical protein
MATATIQDVLTRARATLGEPEDPELEDGVSYLNADLLIYVADGIARAAEIRPDLRFGKYLEELPGSYRASDSFPLKMSVLSKIASYVVFRAESADDDHVNSKRAIQFMQLFEKELTT